MQGKRSDLNDLLNTHPWIWSIFMVVAGTALVYLLYGYARMPSVVGGIPQF